MLGELAKIVDNTKMLTDMHLAAKEELERVRGEMTKLQRAVVCFHYKMTPGLAKIPDKRYR